MRQFDYIIKAETSEEDAQLVLDLLSVGVSELERRNEAENSLARDPAAVGQLYKDIQPGILNTIMEYYQKDLTYLGYGLDKVNWRLTF